ncbi:hypothetical protein AT864_01512 [Anoxybacillus sp. P3H1B]|uniref:phage tail assembly chaperone G n=1 Tax=Anoxybacillus sp. P3H1B TaxID=1769293 RepID=UPI0007935019|nr:hypothetical protein [Anoxybacillus sp. P3H1B]KXG09952.1 hypothetical protein AT864_01512 [Anoxybacillus sp. P3H1B]
MQTISITLKIDGKDKRFVTPAFISGKLFRLASEIAEEIESANSENFDLDKYLQFVCDAFGNKFDVDQLEEGLDARMMMKTIFAVVNYVIGNIEHASMLLAQDQGGQGKN